MWPFKKKFDEVVKKELPKWWDGWLRLQDKYPAGSTFQYLGITMLVIGYQSYIPGLYAELISIPTQFPEMICQYSDKNGVLRTKNLGIKEGLLLLKNSSHSTWPPKLETR